MALIDIDGVSKTYALGNDRELTAIDRIALSIREGEFVSIIGPSGCGKSTLLSLLAGLDRPSGGTLEVRDGRPALIFQDAALFPWLTVAENIAFPLRMARVHRPDLILMDIQLPEVSGLEVTKWLKEDDDLRTIPVIAVTAFAMKGDEEKIRNGGCEAYIAKPISVAGFMRTIERFLP